MPRDFPPTPSHDAFWIFSLWRALHGDATLADIAAAVIANLSQFLPTGEDSFGMIPPPLPCESVAHRVDEAACAGDERNPDSSSSEPLEFICCDPDDFSIHHNYFEFKGVFYRIDRPALACLPTAA